MKNKFLILTILLVNALASNAQLQVFTDDYGAGMTTTQFSNTFANFWSVTSAEQKAGTSALQIAVGGSGALYSGGTLGAAANQNLTAYNALTFWIKASRTATLNSVGFGNSFSGGSVFSTSISNLALTTTWTKIIIPIPAPAKLGAEKGMFWVSEAANDASGGAYNIFVDDIQFENLTGGIIGSPTASIPGANLLGFEMETFASTATVTCSYPINSVNQSQSCTMAYLNLTSADPSIATVNATGSLVTAGSTGTTSITGTLAGVVVSGSINVTVFSPAVMPPTPLPASNTVKSLFSDAYSNATVNTWSLNTARATATDVNVGGNTLKRYYFVGTAPGTNYCQIQFLLANAIDASGYTYLHVDAFTPNAPTGATATTFQLKLVDGGADNQVGGTALNLDKEHNINLITLNALTPNTWVGYDIPLSSFSTLPSRANLIQMLLTGTLGSTIYLDNIVLSNAPQLMPVSLSAFEVVRQNHVALLSWTTASELSNKGFAIERSADNMNWQEIAFVAGTGSPNAVTKYNYQDKKPLAGKNYYRLRQIDADGKSKSSAIRVLDFLKTSVNHLACFPNPASSELVIELGEITGNNARIELMTLDGKIAKSLILNRASGNSMLTVNVSHLNRGFYLLRLRDEGTMLSQKIVLR